MRIEYSIYDYVLGLFVDVEGDLLHDLAPHLAHVATFAINRDGPWWVITNLETGCKVGNELYRTAAIAKARKKLAEKTPEDVEKAYRKWRRDPQWRKA